MFEYVGGMGTPSLLTAEAARGIGVAYAANMAARGISGTVSVGRDNRPSGAMLRDALVDGLTASGVDVIDIGVVPTPVTYWSMHHLPVVGAIMRDPALAMPERHLGLVQASEHAGLAAFIDRMADMVEASLDLDAVLELAAPFKTAGEVSAPLPTTDLNPFFLPPPGQRIALADDAAFTFLYPHVAAHWREAGAEIVPFSPLADEGPRAEW